MIASEEEQKSDVINSKIPDRCTTFEMIYWSIITISRGFINPFDNRCLFSVFCYVQVIAKRLLEMVLPR